MTAARRASDVAVGDRLGPIVEQVDRARLIAYAGASGDFNPLHWSDRAAAEAGLPDVIAHGMLTMALAFRLATAWAGDPGAVRDLQTRFVQPLVVPDSGSTTVTVDGIVEEITPDRGIRIAIEASAGGTPLLSAATALVVLP